MSGSANGCGAARKPGCTRIPTSPLSKSALTSPRLVRQESRSSPTRSTRTHAWFAEQTETMAPTQDALYRDLELDLSWSERELPERERTRHVHRLHPYLGKFIPQLDEAVLSRYFAPGQHVLERELRAACERIGEMSSEWPRGFVRTWFAPQAARELLGFGELVDDYINADVLRVVLGRAARSARRTTHFDLDFPREPQHEEYWCHKHKRVCRPVGEAAPFLRRYALDTLERIKAFSRLRARARAASVLHGDARELDFGGPFDGVVTSPPYPGLIDYHEQHRYAYELLGLDDCRELEVGAGAAGASRAALEAYSDGIVAVFKNLRGSLRAGSPVVIVVNDRRGLYPEILERSGLVEERRHRRHVNR